MNFRFRKKIMNISVFVTILVSGGFGISNINNSDKNINNLISNTEINYDLDENQKVIHIDVSQRYSSALTNKGAVYTWGSNHSGQLGDGTTKQKNTPINITNNFEFSENEQIIQLDMGGTHSSALTNEGNVYTWGSNSNGQLGDNSTTNKNTPTKITSQFNFDEVDEQIIQLGMGEKHSSALTNKGNVYTWGINNTGQLGNGTTIDNKIPIKITEKFTPINGKITQLSMGYWHSSALTNEGDVYTWGYNDEGQLGDGTTTFNKTPKKITDNFPSIDGKITQLSMGAYHSSALTNKGNVYTWGYNGFGQLGDQTVNNKLVPTNITDYFHLSENKQIKKIDMGVSFSSALTDENVYTWGRNRFGQLGDGTTSDNKNPTNITDKFNLNGNEQFTELSISDNHSAVLTSKGNTYTWGSNDEGQLGRSLEGHKIPGEVIFSSHISKSNVKNITSNSATIYFALTILNNENPETEVTILNNGQEIFTNLYKSTDYYLIYLGDLKSNEEYNLSIFVDNWFQESIDSFKTLKYTSENIEKDVHIKIKDKENIKDLDNEITLIYSQKPSLNGTTDHLITYKDGAEQKISISSDQYSDVFQQTYNLDQPIINIKQIETFYEIDGYRVLLESHSGSKNQIFKHLKNIKPLLIAVIGVVLGTVIGVILMMVLIMYFLRINKKNNKLKLD